jgi:acyl-CoA thioesterase
VTSFAAASSFEQVAPGDHRGEIDAAWAQGRGVYGGLVTALLVRAIEHEAPRGQAIASIHVLFLAPATAGPARIRIEAIRVGRNVSAVRAELLRDDQPLATALATLARPREGALAHDTLSIPDAPLVDRVADGPAEHYIPAFARRFAFRQTHGPRPFSGGAEARVAGWCRIVEENVPIDAALACAVLDAWPPAAVAVSPSWCPVASVELTVQFLAPLPIAASDWLFYDASATHVSGGLADERATLWTSEGTPIATARQLIAIFPPAPRPE